MAALTPTEVINAHQGPFSWPQGDFNCPSLTIALVRQKKPPGALLGKARAVFDRYRVEADYRRALVRSTQDFGTHGGAFIKTFMDCRLGRVEPGLLDWQPGDIVVWDSPVVVGDHEQPGKPSVISFADDACGLWAYLEDGLHPVRFTSTPTAILRPGR